METRDLERTASDWRTSTAVAPERLIAPSAGLCLRLSAAVPLIVLHAPAGFGKTCAMAVEFERLKALGINVTWIAGRALAACRQTFDDVLEQSSTRMFDAELVFLDDADRVDHALLSALLSQSPVAPGPKRLILSARRIDGLRLARRISEGAVDIIPGDLLLWHRRQVATAWRPTVSAQHVAAIDRLTEGWPAPTQLLARFVASGETLDEDEFYLKSSLVSTYIDDEVVSAFPDEWRQVIAATALPSHIDQVLLDRLSDIHPIRMEDIRDRVGELLANRDGVWRYNLLLRKHLLRHYQRLPAATRQTLSHRVADWAADRGDVVSAAHFAAQGGHGERIVEFMVRAGGLTLWLAKGYDYIKALVDIAGDAHVLGEPRLQLLRCVVLLKEGRVGEADRLYGEALKNLPEDAETRRDAALVQATLAVYGCRTASAKDKKAFRLLDQAGTDPGWKTMLPTIRAIRHSQQAEFGAALAAIVEATEHGVAAGIKYNLLFLDFHRAGVFLAQGSLDPARKALMRGQRRWKRDYADDHGAETVMHALFAQLDFESGRRQQAVRHLRKSAHRLPHSEAWLDIYVAGYEPMIRLLAEEHGLSAAVAAIERASGQLHAQGLDRIADLLTALRFCLEGEAWLNDRGSTLPKASPTVHSPTGEVATWQEREFGGLAAAYRALASDAAPIAQAELNALVDFATERGLQRTLLRAFLLRCATLDMLDDHSAAEADFEAALTIAENTGLRRAFSEFGGPSITGRLAALEASESQESRKRFARDLGRPRAASANLPRDRLTQRERQVLNELVAGGSDKVIGRRLGVTEHAVRFHLKNLYVKLRVHDRASAIAKSATPANGLQTY